MKYAHVLYFVAVIVAKGVIGAGSGTDLYPEIRALIREAETSAVNIPFLDDRSNPTTWAASLYARAGYLDDAARAFGKLSVPPYVLWRARVLYGDLAGAEKSLESIADPEDQAGAMTSLADLLWRMGEPTKARIRLEAARQIAPKITNPEHRKRMLTSIEQGLKYLTDEPPNRLSTTPSPQKRFDVQDSQLPLFPITTEGFRDRDLNELANRANADGEFMKKLYGRMGAGDRPGLLRIAESAATPFQKALGMASIEHIMIQAGQPETADQYAKQMPEIDSDTSLAKAEALSAAGAAWLRAGDASRAHLDFEAAIRLVKSVRDLPLGRILVMVSIATAQTKGGLVASGVTSFQSTKEMVQELPARPKGPAGKAAFGIHYKDEAFREILLSAIRVRDLRIAREVAEQWKTPDGKADTAIVQAWLDANRLDEAVVFALKIVNPAERVKALLVLAQELLNAAGAPNL